MSAQSTSASSQTSSIPFDARLLDDLMDAAGLDAIVATSKHATQYLLGGYRAQFFSAMDAVGTSRYVPVVVYVKRDPAKSAFIGHRFERNDLEVQPPWVAEVIPRSTGSIDAVTLAAEQLKLFGLGKARVGVEMAFLPFDAMRALGEGLPNAQFSDALVVLERLRARKSAAEINLMRQATEGVAASMAAVVASTGPGTSKRDIVERLRREEVMRGLNFEYCLIAAGKSFNRAPSSQTWELGDILSIDSGGNYQGYLGDIARMAILGEPDQELIELLGEIETVQQAAIKCIKPGVRGGDVFSTGQAALSKSYIREYSDFMAHGVGLVTHEAPRLTRNGPVPYEAPDAALPLETGMVLSVETTMRHPSRGFIKLEDTIAVSDSGYEMFAQDGRGWNQGKWR